MVKLPSDLEVSSLSDEELFQRLKTFGVDVGPIVGSTRALYERKLHKLIIGDEAGRSSPETHHEVYDNDEQDDDDNFVENDNSSFGIQYTSPRYERNELPSYSSQHHSPTLSTTSKYTLSSESSLRSRPVLSSETSKSVNDKIKKQQPPNNSGLIIKLVIMVAVMSFIIFIVYQAMESDQKNPIPSV